MNNQPDNQEFDQKNIPTLRLQKFLSDSGISSRRGACSIIKSGRVKVNGKTVLEPGMRIVRDSIVELDGKRIYADTQMVYYIYYKPRGLLTSMKDPNHDDCLGNHLKHLPWRVFPVGRLDKESEGLLLLTNDGDLANKLLHPSHHVKKEYSLVVTRKLNEQEEEKFRSGVAIHNNRYITQPCGLKSFENQGGSGHYTYRVIISEGKKRQIREMFGYFNVKVLSLKRIKMGCLDIGDLLPGQIKKLTKQDISRLLKEE